MRKIQRGVKYQRYVTPENLENTRPPMDYLDATVKAYNDAYKQMGIIDPAKARVIKVRQNSHKPWEAYVTLGEDITDKDGKFVKTNQRTTTIERQEMEDKIYTIERVEGESPFDTLKKVETAAGLEAGDLHGGLSIGANTHAYTYTVRPDHLNFYGKVQVRFVQKAGEK